MKKIGIMLLCLICISCESISDQIKSENPRKKIRAINRIQQECLNDSNYLHMNSTISSQLVQTLDNSEFKPRVHAFVTMVEIGKLAVPELIKTLEDSTSNRLRANIVRLLDQIGDSRAIPVLIKQLDNPGTDSYKYSKDAIFEFGKLAVPELIKALESSNSNIRRSSALILIKTQDSCADAIPVLVKTLYDPNISFRNQASQALIEIGKPAVPELINALENQKSSTFHDNATLALRKIGDSRSIPVLIEHLNNPDSKSYTYSRDALIEFGELAEPELKKALESSNSNIRRSSALILIKTQDSCADAIPVLVKTLYDPNISFRNQASQALIEIGKPAVPELINALEYNNELIKTTLIEIGKQSESKLIVALESPNEYIRGNSAYILGTIDSTISTPYLIDMLNDSSEFVRKNVAVTLIRMGNIGVCPVIIQMLGSSNSVIRQDVNMALEQIGESVVPYLVNALQDSNYYVKHRSQKILIKIGNSAVADLIKVLNSSRESDLLVELAYILGEIGSTGAIGALQRLQARAVLANFDYSVNKAAWLAVEKIKRKHDINGFVR